MVGSSTVRIEWEGHVVGALEDVDFETVDVGSWQNLSGRWVPVAGPGTDRFLEALAKQVHVEVKAAAGYSALFAVDSDGTGRLFTQMLPERQLWEHRLRRRAQRCAECSSWSYPVPATGDLYRCSDCGHEFAGPVHDLEPFADERAR